MIHTKTFEMAFTGFSLLMEQKAIGRPSGAPQSSVTAKISSEIRKPSQRFAVTSQSVIAYFWSEKSVIAVLLTPYFAAIAAIVPSAASFSSCSFTLAVRSLPFLKPIA